MEMQEKAKESGAKKEEKLSSSGFESLAGCIYCDYNATTPIYPEVFQAMEPYLTKCFGNPSSSHAYGQLAKTAVITGRKLVADAVNAKPEDIYFVSCGSEADNRCIDIAIHNFYLTHDASSIPQIITSSIEHPAILCYLRTMQLKKKLELKVVPVDSQGFVSLTEFENALSPNVALVTIMHSNNEIGTIEPIRAMSKIIRRYNKKANTNILFHTDAAQSIGKVVVDVNALDVDMLTIVGHKFGAPKGIAALYVRNGVNICQFLIGGSQEKGFRAGNYLSAL
jgi:cysteine desulfurase